MTVLIGLVAAKMVVEYIGDNFDYVPTWNWRDADSRVWAPINRGTVYSHNMLGDYTPHFPQLFDGSKLVDANERERQPDKDYTPFVRTSWGRLVNADEGYTGNLLPDYDAFKEEIDVLMSGYSVSCGDLTRYVTQALRLVLSGSSDDAIVHVIADTLIANFWDDSLPIKLELVPTKQRSKDGSLTGDDKARFAQFDAHIQWLEQLAVKIVAYAVKISCE